MRLPTSSRPQGHAESFDFTGWSRRMNERSNDSYTQQHPKSNGSWVGVAEHEDLFHMMVSVSRIVIKTVQSSASCNEHAFLHCVSPISPLPNAARWYRPAPVVTHRVAKTLPAPLAHWSPEGRRRSRLAGSLLVPWLVLPRRGLCMRNSHGDDGAANFLGWKLMRTWPFLWRCFEWSSKKGRRLGW